MFRMARAAATILAGSAVGISSMSAQVPSPSVSVGFGVDTTISDVRNIFALVRAYLAKPDSSAKGRGLWSLSSDFDRRVGDISAGQAYQGFRATVVGIVPAVPGDSVYTVKILHARADSSRRVTPLALQRLYALRELGAPFAFRLSAALPRLTKNWVRRSKGRITFRYAPGVQPNVVKINHAALFVDSVARLFSVPTPPQLDVYITNTLEEGERAIGLDFFPEASGPGEGRGGLNLGSGIVLAGDPAIGEAYFHEYVHTILGAALPAGNGLLGEGVATWLGGSRGRTPRDMYALLRRYEEAHPTITLSALLHNDFETDAKLGTDLRYATGALVANALYRRQGIAGVRKFYQLKGDTDTLLRELAAQLGLPLVDAASLDNWWRTEAARASNEESSPRAMPSTRRNIVSVRDTSEYGNPTGGGKLGLLYLSSTFIDSVDIDFGIHRVGDDSLVFLPVRGEEITDHVLFDGRTRVKLAAKLPYFDSYFSSPIIVGHRMHYWGLRKLSDADYQIYAMRYDFPSALLDSLALFHDEVRTDYQYYFATPEFGAGGIHYKSQTTDYLIDTAYTRLIRKTKPSPPLM